MGIYTRGNKIWLRFQDATGRWRSASSGYNVGDEGKALQVLAEVKSRIAAERGTENCSTISGTSGHMDRSDVSERCGRCGSRLTWNQRRKGMADCYGCASAKVAEAKTEPIIRAADIRDAAKAFLQSVSNERERLDGLCEPKERNGYVYAVRQTGTSAIKIGERCFRCQLNWRFQGNRDASLMRSAWWPGASSRSLAAASFITETTGTGRKTRTCVRSTDPSLTAVRLETTPVRLLPLPAASHRAEDCE